MNQSKTKNTYHPPTTLGVEIDTLTNGEIAISEFQLEEQLRLRQFFRIPTGDIPDLLEHLGEIKDRGPRFAQALSVKTGMDAHVTDH